MTASPDTMKQTNPRRTGMVVAWVATLSLIVTLGAQTADGQAPRVPLAQDWSHRHLIYSAPATVEQARRLQTEPRYWHQWIRRHGGSAASIDAAAQVLEDVLLRRTDKGHATLRAG